MLFNKDITKITFEDVVTFCEERIKESVNLDYKKDFPPNLEKTIAAFANTTGGLIIIGVEDQDGRPKLPVEGLPYTKGLSEKVTSIILDNIYPPVFPEIQVCEPCNNKTFVIIRVPQSDATPHYIAHKTEVYIRTNDINHPEALATADRIEWLINKRKKSEELRGILYSKASKRYANYLELKKCEGIQFGEATISMIPLYPSEPYISPQEIETIYFQILNGLSSYLLGSNQRPIEGGISDFVYDPETHFVAYNELNQFGLIYHKKDLGLSASEKEGEQEKFVKKVFLSDIIQLIGSFFEAATNFYEKLGYWGLVEFKFSLEKLLGIKIEGLEKHGLYSIIISSPPNISVDSEIQKKGIYSVVELKNKRSDLIINLIKDIGWSLGWDDITKDKITKVLKENHRL